MLALQTHLRNMRNSLALHITGEIYIFILKFLDTSHVTYNNRLPSVFFSFCSIMIQSQTRLQTHQGKV